MSRFDTQSLKRRLLKLALLKSTGTPADLAFRFEISERSVKRIVCELRSEGVNIQFSQSSISYLTDETAEKYLKHVV